jgi:hypothetical protein
MQPFNYLRIMSFNLYKVKWGELHLDEDELIHLENWRLVQVSPVRSLRLKSMALKLTRQHFQMPCTSVVPTKQSKPYGRNRCLHTTGSTITTTAASTIAAATATVVTSAASTTIPAADTYYLDRRHHR